MNKKEFMQKLKQLLPDKDKRDILLDYEEHFLSGLTDGKTEEEIVKELGSPEEVAKEFGYTGTAPIRTSVWAAIGLVTFDIFIGISILATLVSLWIGLWCVPVACFFAGVAMIIASVFTGVLTLFPWYILLTGGIASLAFGILAGVGMVYVTKAFYLGVKWFVMLHVKIFSGK